MSGPPPPGAEPSEEELRAAYEAELARITATDMIAQAAVSLLNIGARRMGPPPAPPGAEQPPTPPGGERDLEQVRDAIDAAMALLGVLERRVPAEQLRPLRDALSRLQMAYAAEVGGPGEPGNGEQDSDGGEDGPGGPGGGGPGGGPESQPGPGPGRRGRLRARAGTSAVQRPAVGPGPVETREKAGIGFRQSVLRRRRERASDRGAR